MSWFSFGRWREANLASVGLLMLIPVIKALILLLRRPLDSAHKSAYRRHRKNDLQQMGAVVLERGDRHACFSSVDWGSRLVGGPERRTSGFSRPCPGISRCCVALGEDSILQMRDYERAFSNGYSCWFLPFLVRLPRRRQVTRMVTLPWRERVEATRKLTRAMR